MQANRSRYPGYDVLKEQQHWDEHTREIVLHRQELERESAREYKFLHEHEVQMVLVLAQHIVYESSREILNYCVQHLDNALSSPTGEDQREVGVPEQKTLVRQGLAAMDELAQKQFGVTFLELGATEQLTLLTDLATGKAMAVDSRPGLPQKQLFKKLATLIVSAYYSHPTVWSEIGYGGPAYPRGYVRVEKGLTDPWEAKRDAHEA